MTLHASKGLEFPVVHVVALEDGLIPHERSRNEADDLEEERRLLFVGITRAQEELYLSVAHRREFRGQRRITIPSMFLFELPLDEIEQTAEAWVDPIVDAAPAREAFEEAEFEAGEAAGDDNDGDDSFAFGALAEESRTDDTQGEAAEAVPAAGGAASGRPGLARGRFEDGGRDVGGRIGRGRRPTEGRKRRAAYASLSPGGRGQGEGEHIGGATTNTAAELFAELTPAQKISPESFFQGMLVRHPEYGLGKVVACPAAACAARRRWHLRPVLARRNSSSARARYGRRRGREKFGRPHFGSLLRELKVAVSRCPGTSTLIPKSPRANVSWLRYHSVGE